MGFYTYGAARSCAGVAACGSRAIVVASKQYFTIGNVQPPLVQADRDPLLRQPAFGVDVKALNAHIAIPGLQ
jgi:hypothetical protein